MNNNRVIIEKIYDAPAYRVWEALTDIMLMKQWYFSEIDHFLPEPGFETSFTIHHNGQDYLHFWKVVGVEKNKYISYEWKFGGFPGNSLLSFDLAANARKTKMVLTHEGLASFEGDQNPALSAENFQAGWEELTGKLGRFLRGS